MLADWFPACRWAALAVIESGLLPAAVEEDVELTVLNSRVRIGQ
jgi:hypothetical protein